MRILTKLTWVEMKLFLREPVTMVFTFALPLLFLFVMGGVFGNSPDPEGKIYRGVGPMDYYVPAYIALVACSIGLIGLPVHLTSYRERGVLRRLHASSVPVWGILGAQMIVSLTIAAVGGALLTLVALLAYGAALPKAPGPLVAAFVVSVLGFVSLGVLFGAVLPTARAALGVGMVLFFVMLMVGGAGPPREVLTQTMRWVGDGTPLRHVVILLQDPWLGFGWNWMEFVIVAGTTVAAALVSVWVFRWQ